ncbi:hypothetical protein BDY17DRAFT_299218 [Neohortaea acidophila]|uniref:ER membrane protein complex subunit 1 n=1 Tax=Neohortaea acidophila TaxID=245834 RepID=A0A6A6PS62_9PEZI|nr:uncharacterized protein BDY17DRAFT_299218 [Neohortaea acidophila]KAF2482822.1 hypothetical protein BDY17DRAFT_299218 [Neohortaea acidophila]
MLARLLILAVSSLLLRPALAVFADEAWNIDYHYALLGEPQQDTTFFHQPYAGSRASLVYTLSNKGALGAVNPRDGSLIWRQLLASNGSTSTSTFLRAGENADVLFSGIASQAAAWSAGDGRLVWEVNVAGDVKDVEILELSDGSATASGSKDALVLSGSDSHALVQRLDGATGTVKWQHNLESGDIPYQVSASTTQVFAILLHKTMLGYYKIKVLSLDPVTGHKTDEYTLSSENELTSTDGIIAVGANSASPIIAWTDATHSVLKVNIIGTKQIASFNIEKSGEEAVQQIQIHAPHHSTALAHFLVHFQTATSHWAEVFHIDLKRNKIEKAYDLPKLSGKGAFATSTSDANVYFTRVTDGEVIALSSASHGVLGRWPIAGFGVASVPGEAIEPIRAVSELSIKGDLVSAIRTAVLLSTGDWILLREGTSVWHRPEGLAGTFSAAFSVPAPVESFVEKLEKEASINPVQAYILRIKRHIEDLQHLPAVIVTLPQRFISGFLGTSADGDIGSDSFGFHKIIACATEGGRLIALDAGAPDRILWNRKIGNVALTESALQSPALGVFSLAGTPGIGPQYFNASSGAVLPGLPSTSLAKEAADSDISQGIQFTLENGGLQAYDTNARQSALWSFAPMPNERIIGLVSRPVNDPVASIGKVLGDRRVLYKYLNPNLALLTTADDKAKSVNLYLLDTISGSIMHSSSHQGINLDDPISSTMSENWFAYSFTSDASPLAPKGHYLVVGEMFESLVPNDRGPLSATTNFSTLDLNPQPFTLVHSYQIPESLSHLTVTQTRQGITSRALLAVLADSHAIISIPYMALDPRRPVDRDATTDEQMEGLFRYAPVLEFDPKWYLNHRREVAGIKHVLTTPALIESTSIVFAYGLDVFGTRLSPSFSFDILGKDFNKFQMLATVAALAVATVGVAPLVMRKQINMRWQFT